MTPASSRPMAVRTRPPRSSSGWAIPAATGKATRWWSRPSTTILRSPSSGADVSDVAKVTERFTRVDADTVRYQFTVNDPKTWVEPFSGEYNMVHIDSPIYEYACHEGNYGMANNLSGARATEKK